MPTVDANGTTLFFEVDGEGTPCVVLHGGLGIDHTLGEARCPTLVVAGRHDVFTSFPQAHRIGRRIPGARVEILEDSGHFPWLDEPDAFFALVHDWLSTSV